MCGHRLLKSGGHYLPRRRKRAIPAHMRTFRGQSLGLTLPYVGSSLQTSFVTQCTWLRLAHTLLLKVLGTCRGCEGLDLTAFDQHGNHFFAMFSGIQVITHHLFWLPMQIAIGLNHYGLPHFFSM